MGMQPATILFQPRSCKAKRWRFVGSFGVGMMGVALSVVQVQAQEQKEAEGIVQSAFLSDWSNLQAHEMLTLTVLAGLGIFVVLAIVVLFSQLQRYRQNNHALEAALDEKKQELEQLEVLVTNTDTIAVIYNAQGSRADIFGGLGYVQGVPSNPDHVVQYESWLSAEAVQYLNANLDRLKASGQSFEDELQTRRGNLVYVAGRAVGEQLVLKICNLQEEKQEFAQLRQSYQHMKDNVTALKALAKAVNQPIWLRDIDNQTLWVNQACLRAMNVSSVAALQQTHALRSFLGQDVMTALDDLPANGASSLGARTLHAHDGPIEAHVVAFKKGSFEGGLVFDGRDQATDFKNISSAEKQTLDHIRSAIALFDENQKLTYYNKAYQELFHFADDLLSGQPTHSAILDAMRAARLLPEQADFRQWKATILDVASHGSEDGAEDWWYLPDGRTLRVLARPNDQGGSIWIFENISEQIDLESRYNALMRVQGETLDALREGVAVFGSDGILKLINPSFRHMWELEDDVVAQQMHVNDLLDYCRNFASDNQHWDLIKGALTGVLEKRDVFSGRFETTDHRILDYVVVPLLDGVNMVTFADVTDTVAVERALQERNMALEEASQIKSTFVEHVSYELRSPLTSVIGFAQLMGEPSTGPLNDKQKEYLNYILHSSSALLALVNDILDLATMDAGILTLDPEPMNMAETIRKAAEGLKDRLAEKNISVKARIVDSLGTIVADEKRVRQILFNLLSNAVSFSPRNTSITLDVMEDDIWVIVSVRDQGVGMKKSFWIMPLSVLKARAVLRGATDRALVWRWSRPLWNCMAAPFPFIQNPIKARQ
jgi:signal transduction histidine kinase